MSSRQGKKSTAGAADLKDITIAKTRHIEAAPMVNELHKAEVSASYPIVEKDTDASD